jgi:small GTP-binding protein
VKDILFLLLVMKRTGYPKAMFSILHQTLGAIFGQRSRFNLEIFIHLHGDPFQIQDTGRRFATFSVGNWPMWWKALGIHRWDARCKLFLRGTMSGAEVKVILVGEAGVGKTCIVERLSNSQFDCITRPTATAAQKTVKVTVDGLSVFLRIWDTAGAEAFRVLVPMYFHGAQAVIVVYAVDAKKSFDETEYWFTAVAEHLNQERIALFLVGNKADLEAHRQVATDEGRDRAEIRRATFFETSARTSLNIQELFQAVARRILCDVATPPTDPEAGRNGDSCCGGGGQRNKAP